MRVVVVTPDFPPRHGGIQLLMARLVEHASSWTTTVIAPDHPHAGDFDASRALSVLRTPRLSGQAATVAALNTVAAYAGPRYRPDAVVSAHIVASPASRLIARRAGVPWIQYTHAKELGTRPRLARSAVRAADGTIVVSTYTAKLVRDLGAPADRIHRVRPGSDEATVPPHRQSSDSRTIVTVARLEDRYKGFDLMLRALPLVAARVPEARWVIVGDGPLRPEIERTAQSWGLGHLVDARGRVSDDERDAALANARVFAMPSRVPPSGVGGEGFGIVFLEAGRYGVPCVAARAGGAVDAVLDGKTGLLVDPTDHLELADVLTRVLVDDELAGRLGRQGMAHAAERSWSQMAGEVDAVVRSLVERDSR